MGVSNIKIQGTARFTQFTKNFGTVTQGQFIDSSRNQGTILTTATFQGSSINIGTVQLSASFFDQTTNIGTVSSATFNDYSVNVGTVSGNATFGRYSVNSGTVIGTVTLPERDSFFQNVSLLLNADSTINVGNSSFVDSSFNNVAVTNLDSLAVSQGSFVPYSRTDMSTYFNATTYYMLSTGFNVAFGGFGTAKNTVEFWIHPTALSTGTVGIFGNFHSVATNGRCLCYIQSNAGLLSANVGFYFTTGPGSLDTSVITTSLPVVKNRWNHVALVIDPVTSGASTAQINIYVNGVRYFAGSNKNLSTQTFIYSQLGIGGNTGDGIAYFTGYLSNLRVTKNQTLYTSNFTPSDSPLTLTSQGALSSNVLLLTFKENSEMRTRNLGSSVSPITLTSGTFTVSAATYTTNVEPYNYKVHGGSGYFNGSNGLSFNSNSNFVFGIDNFTIDFWMFPTVSGGAGSVMFKIGSAAYEIAISTNSSFSIQVDFWPTGASPVLRITSSANLAPLNVWTHVAVVRLGTGANQTKLYINGVERGAGTLSYNFTNTGTGYVGRTDSGAFYTGYLSNLRVVKGQALYTSNFNPQTTLSPATSNTSLLLHFANGSIYDASSRGHAAILFGNVALTSLQTKFGNNSMYFDGSGDYLTITPVVSSDVNFGTGDFTIEFWVYPLEYGSTLVGGQLFGTKAVTGLTLAGYSINLGFNISTFRVISNASGAWANDVTASSGPALNEWTHMAVVRSGANITIYKNGVSVGTTSTMSGKSYTGTAAYIGRYWDGSNLRDFKGYLADLRVTKGIARYTTNFTPPSAAFPVRN